MHSRGRGVLAILVAHVLMVGAVNAQAICLPPSDAGRHPLFGGLSFRTDLEPTDGAGPFPVCTSVAFGDLDGDGRPDAVFSATLYVTVMLSRGGGVFAPPSTFEAGDWETFVAIADMDGDGNQDVLVCNARGDSISILLGRGDGTLQVPVSYDAGNEPQSLIAEDLDGDGDIDVAVLNILSSDVSLLLNNGDGALADQVRIAVQGVTPRANPNRTFPSPGPFLAAGDLDGDGNIDLAVPAFDRVHLLLGDGAGGFSDAQEHPRTPTPQVYNIKLADLNGDGELDIASSIATGGVSRMVVWLNAGAGSFPNADEYDSSWLGNGPLYFNIGLAIADFSADGMPDIAVASEFFEGVPIHHNLGDGTFAKADIQPTYGDSWFVGSPPAGVDEPADLAILSVDLRSALRIHLNDGRGNLIGPSRMPIQAPPRNGFGSRRAMAASDFDGDGDQDLAVGLDMHPDFLQRIELLENDGTGVFDRTGEIVLDADGDSAARDVLAADLNGDGLAEIIVADTTGNGGSVDPGVLWLLENTGGLRFKARIIHEFLETFPTRMAMHDFDGDGRSDLVVVHHAVFPDDVRVPVERRLMILRNLGDLRFEPVADWRIGTALYHSVFTALGVGDLSGDGGVEIVAGFGARREPGELIVYRHDGGFDFTEIARTPISPHAQNVALADFDHDGRNEIAILHNHNTSGIETEPYLTTYRFDGQLEAIETWSDPGVLTEGDIVAEDFDRDGNVDLALGVVGGRVIMHLGRKDETFDPPVGYDILHSSFALAVADFDGDGRLDFASASINEVISVQFGGSCYTPCAADLTGSSDPREPTYGVPDLDVDSDDFFYYLDRFANGDMTTCDIDADGDCDGEDFFAYLDQFAQGCG